MCPRYYNVFYIATLRKYIHDFSFQMNRMWDVDLRNESERVSYLLGLKLQ